MIGLFLLGVYLGGALYALAASAFVLQQGRAILNENMQRALEHHEHMRAHIIRQSLIAALLWPIAVCCMATGRPPPW